MATCAIIATSAPVSASLKATAAAKKSSASVSFGNFSGLKVTSLAQKKTVEQEFSQVVASCRASGSRGGALSSRCDLASEVIGIIPIMGGMVLVGIALGFVLLRVEAALEESE